MTKNMKQAMSKLALMTFLTIGLSVLSGAALRAEEVSHDGGDYGASNCTTCNCCGFVLCSGWHSSACNWQGIACTRHWPGWHSCDYTNPA